MSRVRLVGDRAYKTKKPVRFGKVDYTTREKRRHACEEEVRLNQELAPGVYLGVTEIDGEPAVEMMRLPQECMLDELLTRGAVSEQDIDAIADVLAAFHAHAPECSPQDVRAVVLANVDRCPDAVRRRLRQALADPPEGGRFLDCHGDLHAANLCLTEGQVVIYDRIEFSAEIRQCDVASDVAFLAMDLDKFGRPDLATRFVRRHGVDPARVAYYKIHRAALRGNVALARDDADAAAAYFNLALGYTVPPSLVTLCGLPGSGKSTLAKQLAAPLRATILRSDAARKQLAGMDATDRWDGGFFEGPYSPEMTQRTYEALLIKARTLVADGVNVIVDAAFAKAAWRERFAGTVVYVDADDTTIRRRLRARAGDDDEISDAGLAEYLQTKEFFEPPRDAIRTSAGEPVRLVLDRLAPRA